MIQAALRLALITTAAALPAAAGSGEPDVPEPAAPPAANEPFAGLAILDRQVVVAAVLDRNPSIEAVRLAWTAALDRVPQAAALDDPMVSWSVAPLSIGPGGAPFGHEARLSQRLPWPGTRRLRGEAARAEAEAAAGRHHEARQRLAAAASMLFDDYYLVHRALEINDAHRALLDDLQRSATARYAAGLAPQQDPLQAELEGALLMRRQIELVTERTVLAATLNALLHRSPEAPLPPPPPMLEPPVAPAAAHTAPPAAAPGAAAAGMPSEAVGVEAGDVGELLAGAAGNPELTALAAEGRARARELELAQLAFFPELEPMAGFNSMWMDREHRWMAGVGASLPVFRRRLRAAVAEAETRVAATAAELAALGDAIASRVTAAHARLAAAAQTFVIYRDRVLPAARDRLAAARTGFESGRSGFLAVIEAERDLRTVELDFHRVLTDWYRARAELDLAVGRVPAIESDAGADNPATEGASQ